MNRAITRRDVLGNIGKFTAIGALAAMVAGATMSPDVVAKNADVKVDIQEWKGKSVV